MLELDGEALKDELFRATDSSGRLHLNLPIRSASDIIDTLMAAHAGPGPHEGVIEALRRAETWILLTDIALSGTSLVSELRRLKDIFKLLGPEKHRILCLCQIATETAVEAVRLDANLQDVALEVGIRVPNSHALNHASYDLLGTPELVANCHALSRWFADNFVAGSNYRLERLAREESRDGIMHYGFGELGWNIVTHKNAPNNSMPLLWFKPPGGGYRPPFERISGSSTEPPFVGRMTHLQEVLPSGGRIAAP